jgi:general secretion pathway protein G
MRKTKSGFTIVELLIVIVVIGVLAAITIVAYNGFQQRAKNAQIISGVKTYYGAILQYKTINEAYPPGQGCIGSGYVDTVQCWTSAGGTAEASFAAASFDTAIQPFIGSAKPTVADKKLALYTGDHFRTGMYYPGAGNAYIEYYLIGKNQTCPIGTLGYAAVDTTQCSIYLPSL